MECFAGTGVYDLPYSALEQFIALEESFSFGGQPSLEAIYIEDCGCCVSAQAASCALFCIYVYLHEKKILTNMERNQVRRCGRGYRAH